MPDPAKPTINELQTFLGMIVAQIGQLSGNTQFRESTGATAAEAAQKASLCEKAVARNPGTQTFYYTSNSGTHALNVPLNRTTRTLMTVDAMKGIIGNAFTIQPARASLSDALAGVTGFETKSGLARDPALDQTDPVSGQKFTVMAKAEKTRATVVALSQMTMPNTNTPVVIKDGKGNTIDINYGAAAFCEFVGECQAPFLMNSTTAEQARAGRVATNSLRAFEMMVREAARVAPPVAAGQPVTVEPHKFMMDRFSVSNTDTTRSDFFLGVDPNAPGV